ncbi:hypothetical protein TRFO_18833 [Tritrichomonas foetus]|uniref:Importin N-terminal domain-containing protein n=1 Tax=Tritrichomonas foetus TaxID=1144522 RepID=A0A1J4KQ78_9EUKA|nr:hypothetical protein TRFO_18833 [Tritrichomonas foetus]|eukprot:OHT11589.1 hypothetical protein TRFO_18833 [Tritrichomonas foetus]
MKDLKSGIINKRAHPYHIIMVENIEQYRETIINFYESMEMGMTFEDEERFEQLKHSDNSFNFAIHEIGTGKCTNFHVIFQSTIIVNEVIQYNWLAFQENDKNIIISALLSLINRTFENNCQVIQCLVGIADIIALEFQFFQLLFPAIPDFHKVQFMCLLIEEISSDTSFIHDFKTPKEIGEMQTLINPICAQMLNQLPVSEDFMKLLKKYLYCIPNYEMISSFLDKFEDAYKLPNLIYLCSDVLRTILVASPQNTSTPSTPFFLRLIRNGINIAVGILSCSIPEVACEIWYDLVSYSPDFFQNAEFTKFILSELFNFCILFTDPICEFQELIFQTCLLVSEDQVPILPHEYVHLFRILLQITDKCWSNSLDNAISDLFRKIPEQATQVLLENFLNPTPGLFIAICQCRPLPEDFLLNVSIRAINMKDVIPPEHLLLFIWRTGKRFTQFNDQWFEILFSLMPQFPSKVINILLTLLPQNPQYIPKISLNAMDIAMSYLNDIQLFDYSAISSVSKVIKFSKILFNQPPPQLFPKLYAMIFEYTHGIISDFDEEDVSTYFLFVKTICDDLGNIEFNQKIIDDSAALIQSIIAVHSDDHRLIHNLNAFMGKLTFTLGQSQIIIAPQ